MPGKDSIPPAFEALKPLCDSVMNTPTKENINNLKEAILKINKYSLQELHTYITIPCIFHLDGLKLSDDLRIELVQLLKTLITEIVVDSKEYYFRVLTAVLLQIVGESAQEVAPVCEELKLCVVELLTLLTENLSLEIIDTVYTKDKVLKLCHCIYICLDMARAERMRALRKACLNCIMTISYVHDMADQTDKVLRYQVADTVMVFLPGTLSGLMDIVCADSKQGHTITLLAIRAWCRIVALTFGDDLTPPRTGPQAKDEKNDTSEGKKGDQEDMRKRIDLLERNQSWFAKCMPKLGSLAQNLKVAVQHDHCQVRLEVAEMCSLILTTCLENLQTINHHFLEMLIALSEDEYEAVRTKSRDTLLQFSQCCVSTYKKSVVEIVEERYYQVLMTIPRVITTSDTSEQEMTLNLLHGYLRLFEDMNLPPIFTSRDHLDHLMSALICASEFDVFDISLLCEYSLLEFDNLVGLGTPWKEYMYLHEESLRTKFYEICALLGRCDAKSLVVQNLLDRLTYDYENRKEIINLLNEINAVKISEENNDVQTIQSVINLYQDSEFWDLSIEQDEGNEALTRKKSNVVQVCLLTEGIGKFALKLGHGFHPFLFRSLYFLLERAGCKQPSISLSGMIAVENVQKALGVTSVTELLKQNADYLSHPIILKLRHIERNRGVLDVLAIIMRNCSVDILPCLYHIINDVLLQSCDQFQRQNTRSFVNIFFIFCMGVQRWQIENPDMAKRPEEPKPIEEKTTTAKQVEELDKILKEGGEYEKEQSSKTAQEFYLEDLQEREKAKAEAEEIPNNPYDVAESPNANKPEPPPEILLTSAIIARCRNFLSSKKREIKILVLDTLTLGIQIVQYWEDVLLPLVHLVWSPLVDRFKENLDSLIIHKSVLLLHALAETSKDFIRHRATKEVLPQLYKTLTKTAERSKFQDRGAAYRYTQEYKLQSVLLDHLAEIIKFIDVTDAVLEHSVLAAVPYLSSNQPNPLQNACRKYYETLLSFNGPVVQKTLENHMKNIEYDEYSVNYEKVKMCFR